MTSEIKYQNLILPLPFLSRWANFLWVGRRMMAGKIKNLGRLLRLKRWVVKETRGIGIEPVCKSILPDQSKAALRMRELPSIGWQLRNVSKLCWITTPAQFLGRPSAGAETWSMT
jgi:hypothetical protein